MLKIISETTLILMITLLFSCDPSQEIYLVNNRSGEITIRFFESGQFHHSIKNSFSEISSRDGISIVHLQEGSVDTIIFGIGTWEVQNRLDTFLHYLEQVEVDDKGKIEVYRGKVLAELVRNSLDGKFNQILRFDFNEWRGYEFNLENFYGSIDTIIRKKDTLELLNSLYDTVIVREGILTELWYDYELDAEDNLILDLFHQAIELEREKKIGANDIYREIVKANEPVFWDKMRENSDVNGYFHNATSLAIVLSYCYEQLDRIEEAIDVLKPFMANSEDHGTKIHRRFFELCIEKYGVDEVRSEFDRATKTLRKNTIAYPGFDPFVIDIYDAEIGLDIDDETAGVEEVYDYFKAYEFYELLQL